MTPDRPTPDEEDEILRALKNLALEGSSTGKWPEVLKVMPYLRATPSHLGVPLWMHLCQRLAHPHADLSSEQRAAIWQSLTEGAHVQAQEPTPLQDWVDGAWAPNCSHPTHLQPSHVAALCPSGDIASSQPIVPAGLQEALVAQHFRGEWQARPHLTMHLLLVSQTPGHDPEGQAAKLDLWLLPTTEAFCESKPWPHLVRAPSIAMLPADDEFENGLLRVQALLAQLLKAGSPAVAFGIRTESTRAQEAPWLTQINGPSATAALAIGALWMLQAHLRDEFTTLGEALAELRPDRVAVSADLIEDWQVSEVKYCLPSRMRLQPVGHLGHKLALAHTFWQQDGALRLYTAPGQGNFGGGHHDETFDRPADLNALVLRMAEECGRGLSAAQRVVYRCLNGNNLPTAAQWRAAAGQAPRPALSLEAWLLQRATLFAVDHGCAGAIRLPFGPPAQLLDHFTPVHLSLEDGDGPGVPMRPEQLLRSTEFSGVSVWAFQGPPFSGKSTLLASCELHAGIAALKRLFNRPGSTHNPATVEVCVTVDLGDLALVSKPGVVKARDVVHALVVYLRRAAGWLHFETSAGGWRMKTPDSGAPAFGRQGYRRHPVAVRLLFDGLDTLPGLNAAGRSRCIEHIIDWLAYQRPLQMLPAVFAVRSGQSLVALHGRRQRPGWRPRTAMLQPWSRTDWQAHLGTATDPGPAYLPADALGELTSALGLDGDDLNSPNNLQQFCSLPGHLAGVCDLVRRHPQARLPDRPGQLLLALLGHLLADPALQIDPPPDWLYGRLLSDGRAGQASRSDWQLPVGNDCVLLRELVAQSAAMLTTEGLPRDAVPSTNLPPGLRAVRKRNLWLQAVMRLGLAQESAGQFSYSHRPWHALFLALARNRPGMSLPDLTPPLPTNWRPNASLPAAIAWLNPRGRPALPDRTPHHEHMRMAADVAGDPVLWVRRLTPLNLALAAQVAIDHRDRLEAGGPHPWLQLLRSLLLLRSLDAGAAARAAVSGSGLLDLALAAFGENGPLNTLWASAHRMALLGEGCNLRERLDAALLLGMLGDTLRYQHTDPDETGLSAVRLHRRFWHTIIGHGTEFHIAAFVLTQGEWDSFLASPAAMDPQAACWQAAGPAARDWLRARQDSAEPLAGMGLHRQHTAWANPLLPVSGVSLHAARAYVAWARGHGLYDEWHLGQPDLPTEWEWQVAASHGSGPASDAGPVDFNHDELCWHRPSPVGIFSADWTGVGLADMRGNVRQWCSSALSALDLLQPCAATVGQARPDRAASLDARLSIAVRGSGFRQSTSSSGTQLRRLANPDSCAPDLGLRLILRP